MDITHQHVPLPHRLLVGLRDTPLAAGAYAPIAYTCQRAPRPLSLAGLIAFDHSLSQGAATSEPTRHGNRPCYHGERYTTFLPCAAAHTRVPIGGMACIGPAR
jgi:hypothetical protein